MKNKLEHTPQYRIVDIQKDNEDITYLKRKYCGVFIGTKIIKGEEQLFPIAFNIVNAENDDSWL
uniref:MULE transposase domain-containing protein n=1 Tax=Physcomitrium patens TaxID=3218 RepID=A0A2K1J468_PHYPA|nr:hypothetical protein PHYPA_022151 [Physcomitrium patens]